MSAREDLQNIGATKLPGLLGIEVVEVGTGRSVLRLPLARSLSL